MKMTVMLRRSFPLLLGTASVATSFVAHSRVQKTLCLYSSSAAASLPPLLDATGQKIDAQETLKGKHVAYYFSAGWCPMCNAFDPALQAFRSGKELELIYVSSDRSEDEAKQRAAKLNMKMVPYGEQADKLKQQYNIWAGAESLKFGFGRRSGVPALVVLDGEKGEEMAFLNAEAQGPAALEAWPLDDPKGIW